MLAPWAEDAWKRSLRELTAGRPGNRCHLSVPAPGARIGLCARFYSLTTAVRQLLFVSLFEK